MDILSNRQELLIHSVERAAAGRADKAREHPEEARNEQSATALSALAPRLAALAPNDPRLRRSYKIEQGFFGRAGRPKRDDLAPRFVEELNRERAMFFDRYGFGDPTEDGTDAATFLLDLADLTQRCVDELTKRGDPVTAS